MTQATAPEHETAPDAAIAAVTRELPQVSAVGQLPDYPAMVAAGQMAARAEQAAQWVLGDLACHLETHYSAHSLRKYAAEIGVEYETLKDYRRVAAAFPEKGDRSPFSWTVCRILASHPQHHHLITSSMTTAEARELAGRKVIQQRAELPASTPRKGSATELEARLQAMTAERDEAKGQANMLEAELNMAQAAQLAQNASAPPPSPAPALTPDSPAQTATEPQEACSGCIAKDIEMARKDEWIAQLEQWQREAAAEITELKNELWSDKRFPDLSGQAVTPV
jgi:hypothetical protein